MNENQSGHWRAEPRARSVGIIEHRAIVRFGLLTATGAAIVACIAQAISAVFVWRDRYRQRRLLDGLGDDMLKDIGVSRADVDREVSKRLWHE